MNTHPHTQAGRLGRNLVSSARALLTVSALAAVAVPNAAVAQAPTFNTFIPTHKGGGDYWNRVGVAAVGDFNGDGKLDAFVTDGSPNLRLMLGNGNGTFAVQYVYTTATSAPVLVRAADLNGDGRLDAVCASGQGDLKPLVLLNTGNVSGVPQFTVTPYDAFGSGVRSVTVGDLNGDNRPDFIVGNAYASLRVYLNNGSGAFTLGQSTNITGAGGPSVGTGVIVDLNGDGKTDFVVASSQSPTTNVFFGNGNGTLQTPVEITSNSFKVTAADVNNDGKPDLLEVNGANLMIYLNAGGGTFSSPTLYSTGNYPSSVTTADFNGDGNLDAVVANQNSNNVAVLLGDGSGVFGAATTYAVNQVPVDLSVGDFNGDGKPDIATLGYNENTFAVLLNTTVFVPPLPTQTLTILGGSGSVGGVAANVEYFNPATGNWQPAYLTGGHPWGFVPGTNSWINYKTNTASDPGAGPTTNQTLWYLYRVRFTVPADAQDPKMTFSLKADNFAQVAINGVTAGGSTQYINNAFVNNVVVGQADQVNVDAAFSQNVHVGENTITLNIGDWGGLNGFNFRIDLSMKSGQPVEIVPVNPDITAPVITGPGNLTREATSGAGAVVTFTATATDNIDGAVTVVANPASGSTFPLGPTTVDLGAGDTAGNIAHATFTITVVDTTPPALTVPASQTLEATSAAGAVATFAASATDAVGVTSLTYTAASGSAFAIGTTTVTVTAKDGAGNTSTKSFTITVRDTTAPVIASVSPSTATLWPPNHQMVAVTLKNVVTNDAVGVTGYVVTATSNEPDNGLGDGDTPNDIQISGSGTLNPVINLRAERSGKGNGRVYTITVVAVDAAGNASAPRTVTVSVPKSQGK